MNVSTLADLEIFGRQNKNGYFATVQRTLSSAIATLCVLMVIKSLKEEAGCLYERIMHFLV